MSLHNIRIEGNSTLSFTPLLYTYTSFNNTHISKGGSIYTLDFDKIVPPSKESIIFAISSYK